jgi:hypothetical protein
MTKREMQKQLADALRYSPAASWDELLEDVRRLVDAEREERKGP